MDRRLASRRVVPAGAKVQVHPAALPLNLVDLAFAVVLAASLEREQLRVTRERLDCCQQVSYCHLLSVATTAHNVSPRFYRSPSIRYSVGCALIIPMIIQATLLDPSGAVWTDEAANVSRPDPSGAVQVDAEHPACNRKVVVRSQFGDAASAFLNMQPHRQRQAPGSKTLPIPAVRRDGRVARSGDHRRSRS
jgi:hypothetical protein